MRFFSKPKKYVFVQRWTHRPEEWERHELFSEEPMIVKLRYGDYLFLLPDGKVEGSAEVHWRAD